MKNLKPDEKDNHVVLEIHDSTVSSKTNLGGE